MLIGVDHTMRTDKSHTAGLKLARKALKGATTLPDGRKAIDTLLSDSKKSTGNEELGLSKAEIAAGAHFFWDIATRKNLKPAELAEVIRRLASGEHVHDVLPQRFLPLE
ncbi:hypothetical protein [Pseudomonas sp. NPDC096950]|uniref:hypothetical protein n=1 Tax=Pseudomonas sp. NPDC096950 TaxID=3364485 RepID=UPI00383A7C07